MSIVCVVPTVRPERMESFRKAWGPLFEKHNVTLVTVWDGERPRLEKDGVEIPADWLFDAASRDLFCRFTDACRNIGFVAAAKLKPDYVLTLDDDVTPPVTHSTFMGSLTDPIQAHLDALGKRVPLSWMNTAHDTDLYLRGVPYGVRDEAPAMLSHGVWVGVPDFDGQTQLKLESAPGGVPHSLPYYVGPIPRGVLFNMSGMNVMVRREALPYFYFAPMGPDAGIGPDFKCDKCPSKDCNVFYQGAARCAACGGIGRILHWGLNRFSDIWAGVFLKREFDRLGWACYTGASTVHHDRASDARRNVEQEKLGREWNERVAEFAFRTDVGIPYPDGMYGYMTDYADKRRRFRNLVSRILGAA